MTPAEDPQHPGLRTYTGAGLDEVLPRIRAELGEDAVIVARRDGVEGGVGGFFGRRTIEVDAAPARARIDVRDDDPAFARQLADYMAERHAPPAPAHRPTVDPRVDLMPRLEEAPEAPEAPQPYATVAPYAPAGPPAPAGDLAAWSVPEPEPEPEPAASAGLLPPAERPAPASAPSAALDDADALVQASVPPAPAPAAVVLPALAELGPDGAALLATGLSPRLSAELVHTAAAHVAPLAQDPSPRGMLRAALAARIPVATPVRGPGGAVIGFVGPAGSGKTRCVARLATAYAKRSPLPVACVTLHPADGGAALGALLESAGVPVHVEQDAVAAARRIDALRTETIVLLDTPGVSPRAEAELRTLSAELRRLAADELHLTVPATIGPLAARELARAGEQLGVCGIALTHADETAALGTVVELAIDTGVPLSYVARGTALDGGMRPAAADALALALLGPADRDDDLV